jgi:exonuclease SbcD
MTRLAITADIHADDYYGRIDPETGLNARFADFLNTTGCVASTARELECEALVVAGDFTESKTPARAPRVVKIANELARGPDRQLFLRGNHDGQWAGDSIVTDLARRPGWTGHMTQGVELVGDVAICLIPWVSRSWLRAQPGFEMTPDADVYKVLGDHYLTVARSLFVEAERAGARSAILIGHQQLAGGRMTEAQASFLGDVDLVVDSRALTAIGYAAVTFGHVHRGQLVVDDPATPILFVGSIERVDFAEEAETKSFLVVDVADGRATIERIPTPARHFLTIRGDGSFNPAAAEDAIVRAIDLDPDVDTADLRRELERAGAFEVVEIRTRRIDAPEIAGGLAEGLSPEAALETYFADDPDREALVARGRELLTEAAA